MGCFSFRSLLVAAIVISNCITWTASRHSYTHNVSGHRRRHRRQQGNRLAVSSLYVIPGGEGSDAGWSQWMAPSNCSRPCGGGVMSEKRVCLIGSDEKSKCIGGDTKYYSCNTQDCPDPALDFRAQQCAEYNDVTFKNRTYNWVPYTNGPRPCELNCMPKGERFYYRHKARVIDGTRCNDETFDVCVAGECQQVGCDMMLGSNAREDKCRECRGNGTNCDTISSIYDNKDLTQGYNDILLIPEGATNILIEELDKSNNYLALRSFDDNEYYLNGGYQISFPHTLQIAGAPWHYERSIQGFAAPDKLRCLGPTTEPLYLSLLQQEENVGIKYEYSIRKGLMPQTNAQYVWAQEEFTPCSVTCGTGFRTRNVTCRVRDSLEAADESLCDAVLRPITNETCQLAECLPQWMPSPWGPCTKLCGEGSQSRTVQCQKIISNGYPSIVDEDQCFRRLGDKPAEHQKCNTNATCPTWFTGPWKPCDKLCGDGKQTRQVVCHRKTDGRVEVLVDENCEDEKPAAEQPCNIHPCDGIDWVVSNWTGCDSCLSINYTREALCVTKDRQVVGKELCSYHPEPKLSEKCDPSKLPPCESQWYSSQWSGCSVDCGVGVKTRKVFCGTLKNGQVEVVADSMCDAAEKYNDTTPCEVPDELCPAKWFTADWSECTKECDGGLQFRKVMCLSGGNASSSCPESLMPDREQPCNQEACNIDELLSLSSTPVMDDYDDLPLCEEDDEVGSETITSTTLGETMVSDAASTPEGSGSTETEFDFITFTGTGTRSDFAESGSGESESTTESGATTSSDFTKDTGSLLTGETSTPLFTVTESGTSVTAGTGSDSATGSSTESTGETSTSGSTVTKDDSTTDSSGATASESESSSGVSGSATTSELGSTSETGSTSESGSSVTGETATTGASDSTEVTSSDSSSIPPLETTDSSTSLGDSTTSDSIGTTDADTGSTSDSTLLTPTEETTDPSSETTTDSTTDTPTTAFTTDSSETTTVSTTVKDKDKTKAADVPLTPPPRTTPSTSTLSSGVTSTPTSDGSTPTSDGSTPTTDGSAPTLDGSLATSDGLPLTSDGSTPTSDGSTLTLDGSKPTLDGSKPTSDGSTPTSDGSTPSTDGSTPTPDGSTPTTDGSTPTTDGSTQSSDGSTPTSGSTTEAGTGLTSTPASESSTTPSTGSTTEGGSTTDDGLDTSPWDASTIFSTKKPRCRPRDAKAKCARSTFGCCPDKRTAAGGPFDEGCPSPTTCKDTRYGCCPDGVSPAGGSNNEDCPVPNCGETLYGCCASDNKTPAEGNDQEGCPPPCKASIYGCCADNETQATGPHKAGCPETATTTTEPTTESTTESSSTAESLSTEFTTTEPVTSGLCSIVNGTEVCEPCSELEHGCCDDGKTPAHGPDKLGCCLLSPHRCCPDNYQAATGPNHEGCSCTTSKFGCCADNKSYARGANYTGCGCVYSAHGCCPDRHTEATGPKFEGCSCHTYQYGCCPDGETPAEGPNHEGCRCQGQNCCSDGVTAAKGPNQEGCDCSTSEFGCCLDGVTPAQNKTFGGCASVPVNKQAACALPYVEGNCKAYTIQWYYDMVYGGCTRFHYGGCGGNDNRFADKTECEAVCVKPDGKDVCHLPKVKGPCIEAHPRWYFDSERQRCEQFIYGGCLGNENNYKTREECETRCSVKLNQEQQCQQPLEKGPCNGNFARWGFDAGECREFLWGGCNGNSNRFISKAACDLQCNPPGEKRPECQLPQDSGNCTEKIPYWSFSKVEERCLPIYYSGCGGNNNRFTTQEDCEASCPSSFVKDKCTLPVNFGECRRLERRWFYDTKNQQCREFTYGGCNGNANNFYSEQQCNSECAVTKPPPRPPTPPTVAETPASCLLPTEPGTCFGSQLRWTYAVEILECIPFTYTGCGGNGNNFATKENCESVCRPPKDICTLPKVVGPCRVAQPRFYYNAATQRCERFYYGGCRGNANNFETEEECRSQCNKPATTPIPEPSKGISAECRVGDIGQCRGVGRVWYLDPGSARCAPYDSAAGPACDVPGVFPSPEACERSCGEFRGLGDVCRFNKEEGSCNDRQRKYYYDDASKSCQQFTYTGCYGSPNRFSSEEECASVCMPDPCKMPLAMGNCTEQIESWFYDESTDACGPFIYTGCNGNANRFESRGECEGQCKTGVPPLPAPVTPTPERTVSTEWCKLPVQVGNCDQFIPKWYYDEARDSCAQFVYTGCNGNDNRFDTQEDCEGLCKLGVANQNELLEEQCRLPASLQPCGAVQYAFYYDYNENSCIQAPIGGCTHIPNRYRTQEECLRKCGDFRGKDVCRERLDPGPCRDTQETKYYWNLSQGRCEPFTYGGCGGGANRFSTAEECFEVCGNLTIDPACGLPPAPGAACAGAGPARGGTRWHHSTLYGDCRPFVFYGCEGNDNNFASKEECERHCSPPAPGNEIECEEAKRECSALRCEYGITYTKDPGDDCDRCSCDPNPCADMQCGPGQSCHIVPYRAGNNGDIKYTSQCRSDCSSERARCATLQQQCAVQRTRGPDNCERCECIRPEANCQAFEDECRTLQCSYGPVTRTRDADGCERCTCLAHPCEGTQCPEGQRCVVTADRNPLNGDVQYSGNCGTVNKPGSCPAKQAPSSSCHVECNDDADCRGVQKCCASGCSRLCRAPAPDRPTPLYPEPPSAPLPDPATEKAVSSSEGGTATLRCIFTSNPPVHITWKKDEITIDGKQGRYRLTSDGALQIVSLYRNDSGVYICIGENELGSSQQEVELRVDGPVNVPAGIVEESDSDLVGEIGSPLRIRCLAYGYPEPDIRWFRGQDMVPFVSAEYEARGPMLLIKALSVDTLGEYTCQAFNGQGRAVSWTVTVRAERPGSSRGDSPFWLQRAPAHAPRVERPRAEDSSQQIVLYPPAPAPPREFTVRVKTSIRATQTALATGGRLDLVCDVDGYPEPRVYWTKDNQRLSETSTLLSVSPLAETDAGEYGCHADNGYSNHHSTVQITVQKLYIPELCKDNQYFADCKLIVRSHLCHHEYYSKFCCKSCVEAGELHPSDLEFQADQSWTFKKK